MVSLHRVSPRRGAHAVVRLLAATGLAAIPAAHAACDGLLLSPAGQAAPLRAVTPGDLVRLRDIGYPDASLIGGPSPFAVSPDGRRVAFVLNRGDPDSNGYCRALVVMGLAPGAAPQAVDRGGELITLTDVQRGLFVRGGFPALVTPAWSPDGRWIAYLRRDHGVTQAWRARADGDGAAAVTRSDVDVESVAWSADGRRLVYATRPALATLRAATEREGRSGWLYDDRVATFSGPRPQVREREAPLVAAMIDPETGTVTPAGAPDEARLAAAGVAAFATGPAATAPSGMRAWTAPSDPSPQSPTVLHAADRVGREIACEGAACRRGIIGLWWGPAGTTLSFLRREGWDRGSTGLYRWRPGHGAPRRIASTDDVLIGCTAAGSMLVCGRENATTPRRVVLLDPATGRSTVLFDPNPEFAHLALGSVERLKWRNDRGLEAWGDLVLPPGYRPGTRLPMVIVQYHSDGFLRGGTGDDYPIFAFAARGFAVLSLERPDFVSASVPGLKTWDEVNAADYKDWAERRSLLSSLTTGVGMAVARGVADPARIGITGLSDGSTTVRFALINTRLFAAAAISTCCLEPKTVMTYGGIAWAESNRLMGFPPATRNDPAFWAPMSLAQNAARIDTPLLMQLDDDEYILALEAFEALREHGKPVEMYVFPDEFHAKWQPVHRLAIYQRNLDWFDFWLRDRVDPDPAKAPQYARWRAMRAAR